MRSFLLLIVVLSLMAELPMFCQAFTLGPDFQALETQYKQGNLDDLASLLFAAKPVTDEEHALQNYLSAMLSIRKADTMLLLEQTIDRFPGTHYGQITMLERAKIHILEREISPAKILLQKIFSSVIMERYYWLAVCADVQDEHGATISNAETYLQLDPAGDYGEEAYYLLAAAYQSQNKLQSAISTLNKLATIKGCPRNNQYFHYQLGIYYQKDDNPVEALQHYKTGFELNKKSQIALQIEDELFTLKAKYGSRIDLGFLYPYSELEIPLVSQEGAVPETPKHTQDISVPLRLPTKPSEGFFVQAGRFSVEANANKLSFEIRQFMVIASYFEDKGNKSTPWVVVCGPYQSKGEAETARKTLKTNSIDCFITRF